MSGRAAPPPVRLAGKSAVVTGAASGIGRETALRFAGEGAALVCADRDEAGAAAVAAEIAAKGGTALGVAADITSESDVARHWWRRRSRRAAPSRCW